MHCSIKEMIGRLLKRRQHEHAFLHLCNTETGDTQYFALERHDIRQQHQVASVDTNTISAHDVVHFRADQLPRSLNPKSFFHLNDMV